MLRLTNAYGEMAAAMGITLREEEYLTRAMKESGLDLWPEFGRGVRDATIGLDYLIYNLIAGACAGRSPSDAPRQVAESRLLRWQEVAGFGTEDGLSRAALQPWGAKQAEHAEWDKKGLLYLFRALTNIAVFQLRGGEIVLSRDKWPIIRLMLGHKSYPMWAEVTWPDRANWLNSRAEAYIMHGDIFPGFDVFPPRVGRAFREQVYFGYEEFNIFAKVAARVDDDQGSPEASSNEGSGVKQNLTRSTTPKRKKTAPVTSRRGLPEYPVSQTQATPRDPAEIEDSLTQQEASKQQLDALPGSGSRVRAHRSAIRRSKPASRSSDYGANWPHAAAP